MKSTIAFQSFFDKYLKDLDISEDKKSEILSLLKRFSFLDEKIQRNLIAGLLKEAFGDKRIYALSLMAETSNEMRVLGGYRTTETEEKAKKEFVKDVSKRDEFKGYKVADVLCIQVNFIEEIRNM